MVTESSSGFWADRPTFVTGGTGLVGSWLIRRLAERGADLVCLVRDWVPPRELGGTGPVSYTHLRTHGTVPDL